MYRLQQYPSAGGFPPHTPGSRHLPRSRQPPHPRSRHPPGAGPPWRPAARHAGIPPARHAGIPPPPPRGQTHACKNITFATSLRTVNITCLRVEVKLGNFWYHTKCLQYQDELGYGIWNEIQSSKRSAHLHF